MLAPQLAPQVTSNDEAVSAAATPPEPSDSNAGLAPELKVEPADARIRFAATKDFAAAKDFVPPKDAKVAARKRPSVFGSIVRFTVRTTLVAALCGAAWAAWAYYPAGRSLLASVTQRFGAQQNPQQAEIVRTMAQMADDIKALKASLVTSAPAQTAGAVAPPAGAAAPTTSAAIAELASRLDRLEAESTAKLSHISEQLAAIEQQLAASHVAHATVAHATAAHAAVASRAPTPHRHVEHAHDAFDPARDPGAPGAPRPLGAY